MRSMIMLVHNYLSNGINHSSLGSQLPSCLGQVFSRTLGKPVGEILKPGSHRKNSYDKVGKSPARTRNGVSLIQIPHGFEQWL